MHEYRARALLWSPALAASSVLLAMLAGCSSAPQQQTPQKDDAEVMRGQLTDLRALMTAQSTKIESLETRLGSLNEKVNLTQVSVENVMANHKAVATPVAQHPSEGAGTEPENTPAADDPEAGFVTDQATQDFRKGQILLEAQKYPEAVLAFSSFVEKYPDHALAGSAQYGIGEAYFRQKEYKLCLSEFERVLTSYDRSPHVSDTLRDLADAEDALKMSEQAARHRQLLTSLFPQSPAAGLAASGSAPRSSANTAMPHLDEAPASAPTTTASATGVPTAPLTNPPSEVR